MKMRGIVKYFVMMMIGPNCSDIKKSERLKTLQHHQKFINVVSKSLLLPSVEDRKNWLKNSIKCGIVGWIKRKRINKNILHINMLIIAGGHAID